MSKQNKKKVGYKQYERLLALAHQKLEILAEKYHELQVYFISYVEFVHQLSFGFHTNGLSNVFFVLATTSLFSDLECPTIISSGMSTLV